MFVPVPFPFGCFADSLIQLNKEIGELESLIESKVGVSLYSLSVIG